MKSAPPTRQRSGFTLMELLIVIGIIALLIGILMPALNRAREQGYRTRCAANLHQIGQSILLFTSGPPNGGFVDPLNSSGVQLSAETGGGAFPKTQDSNTDNPPIANEQGYGIANSFDPAVGADNVPASLFLLLKTQNITPQVFICPSTDATPGYGPGTTISVPQSSNWEKIPENLSYSYICPFPTAAGRNTIGTGRQLGHHFEGSGFSGPYWSMWDSSFAVAADMNPGMTAAAPDIDNIKVNYNDPWSTLKHGNSNNHKEAGQNVLYSDGHVEFKNTPFCGTIRPPLQFYSGEIPTTLVSYRFRDNIYTAGAASGPTALTDGQSKPADGWDMVGLPTDDEPDNL